MPSTDLATIDNALSDKRTVAAFNAHRFDKDMRWRAEQQYALQIIQGNEQLQSCTPESIQLSMLEVAYTGLSLNPSRGHAYLIPYRNTCTFAPGYKGILHLLFQAGTLKSIQPGLHKMGDPEWRVWTDEKGKHLSHEEGQSHDRSSKPTLHAYVIAKLANGETHIEVMDQASLTAVEEASRKRNQKGGMVWRSAFRSQMEIKAVIRRAASYWPQDNGGLVAHAIGVMDKHDGIDFTKEPREDEPQELLLSEDQRLQLHAMLVERGLEDDVATEWLRLKALAMSYDAIADVPARLFDRVREDLLARLAAVKAKERE